MEAPSTDPELARIDTHQIPLIARDPRSVCAAVGLEWDQGVGLFRDGWISFEPARVSLLDESQEAELVFVGSLVALGCTGDCLRHLLCSLRKPYSYDLRRLFFDWTARQWYLLPGEDNPEGMFFELLDRLGTRNERAVLLTIQAWLDDALEVADDRDHLFSHSELREPPQ